MNDQFKPCPFCGSKDIDIVFGEPVHGASRKTVECNNCWAVGPDSNPGIQEAIDAWNGRSPMSESKNDSWVSVVPDEVLHVIQGGDCSDDMFQQVSKEIYCRENLKSPKD